MINIKLVSEGAFDAEISFWLAILTIVVCAIQVIGVVIFILYKYETLSEEKNLSRCGYFYSNLNYKRGRVTAMFLVIYQLRFLVLATVVMFMDEYRVLQVIIVSLATIGVAAVLGGLHPF